MDRRTLVMGCALVGSACGPTIATTSEGSGDGGGSSDEGAPQTAVSECWVWETGPDTAYLDIAALPDGGIVAVGVEEGRPHITRLDAAGTQIWAVTPAVTAGYYRSVAVLPTGGIVAFGNTVVSNMVPGDALLHGYTDAGGAPSTADHTLSVAHSLSSGVWWNGGKAILAIVDTDDGAGSMLAMFDADGVFIASFPSAGVSFGGLTALGNGYATCGVTLDASQWRWNVRAFDAAGEPRWSWLGDTANGWSGCSIAADGPDRVVWMRAQPQGDAPITVASLRDGEVEWSAGVGGSARAADITIDDDGTAFVIGTEYDDVWVRAFAGGGADPIASEQARGRFEAASLWSGDRLFHAGYDDDGKQRGFVRCLELRE